MESQAFAQLTRLSQFAAGSVVAGLWEGLALAAAVGVCLRLAPKMAATVRFLLWTITFLVLAVVPFLHLETPVPAHPASSSILRLDIGWSLAIAVIWAATSIFRLAQVLRQAHRLRGIWKRAVSLPHSSQHSAGYIVRSRKVELCLSSDVDRPSVIGFFSPKILLPPWLLEKITPPELDQIVLHELEHLRRGDDWFNLLQKLGLALFPLNPVLVWIEHRLCLEREMACDDSVLAKTSSPRSYAACLANLAEHSMLRSAISLSLGVLERQSQLAQRVYRILRAERQMQPRIQATFAGAILFAVLAGATGLARCPQIVSFVPAPGVFVASSSLPYQTPATIVKPTAINTSVQLSTGARATFVKATMPTTDNYPAVALYSAPVHRKTIARTVGSQRIRPRKLQQGNWLVLISDDISVDQPAMMYSPMVLTVFRDPASASSYAAVPLGAGWLLIQL